MDWEELLEGRAEFDRVIWEHRRRIAKKRERRERERFAAQLLKRAEGDPDELARSLSWHPWLAEFIEAERARRDN
ncbi:hypothetical protein ACXZ1M_20405 [Duganella sp. PWIR1]